MKKKLFMKCLTIVGIFFISTNGCKKDKGDIAALNTNKIERITKATAICGGTISSDGNSPILEKGVCWNTSENPTIDNNKTSDGSGMDVFSSSITGLLPNTTYYVRAYAKNSAGTAYGDEKSFTTYDINTVADFEDNCYKTVTIGNQLWMAENLKTTKYNNGDEIPTTNPPTLNVNDEPSPKYQWVYDGNEDNVAIYGRLYTFEAAQDSRGICPVGWHVPSDDDWKILEISLGMSQASVDSMGWRGPNHASELAGSASLWCDGALKQNTAFGTSGFNAIPGGARRGVTNFFLKDYCAYFLSSTYYYGRSVNSSDNRIYRGLYGVYGFSVRCVKN